MSGTKRTILVTGGTGFIGSHTCIELLRAGYAVVAFDDFSNSKPEVLNRIRRIVGDDLYESFSFYEGDVGDAALDERIFAENDIYAIIHFAGFKAVGESVYKPLEYYENNVGKSLVLFDAARHAGCTKVVFSSSATVYGDAERMPITEMCPKGVATNPYGETKIMLERILTDFFIADDAWSVVLLRYFNPIGADESGLIGEDPQGVPNNLLPYVAQVAGGRLEQVHVYGDDYPTPDGTGVRDYIHVVDLARGHVCALDWMAGRVGTGTADDPDSIVGFQDDDGTRHGVGVFNLGTGTGSSVLEVIHAFEDACGKPIAYTVDPRRAGDVPACYASCEKAADELGWTARYDLKRACVDAWRWQSMNPQGM